MTLKEVDIGTTERSLDRELTRTLNHMSHRISMAYSIEMSGRKVDCGPIHKLLVELQVNQPTTPHDDLIDVWRYNRKFDFAAFERAPYKQRCFVLLAELQAGLLEICEQLHLDAAPFEAIHAEMLNADFVYRYRKGKPVANKAAGVSAQLALILTPAHSAVVADVVKIDGGPARTFTFIQEARPSVRFESQYLGKLEWVTSTKLRLRPKDLSLQPVEVDVEPQDV
jgi:hypothetical protein